MMVNVPYMDPMGTLYTWIVAAKPKGLAKGIWLLFPTPGAVPTVAAVESSANSPVSVPKKIQQSFRFASLRIQSYSQIVIRMFNHLLSIVFSFH